MKSLNNEVLFGYTKFPFTLHCLRKTTDACTHTHRHASRCTRTHRRTRIGQKIQFFDQGQTTTLGATFPTLCEKCEVHSRSRLTSTEEMRETQLMVLSRRLEFLTIYRCRSNNPSRWRRRETRWPSGNHSEVWAQALCCILGKDTQSKPQQSLLLPRASTCNAFSVSNSDSKVEMAILSLSSCTSNSTFSCLFADSCRRRASMFSISRLLSCLPRCRSLSTASWYFLVFALSSSNACVWFE